MSRWVLLAFCLAFGGFVLFQLRGLWGRKGTLRGRRGAGAAAATDERLRAARARAAAATSAPARAAALVEAALAAAELRRWTAAAGLFARALRADPAAPAIPGQLVATLGDARPRLVESILWRRLGALSGDAGNTGSPGAPPDAPPPGAAASLASSLAVLYEGALRDPGKANALRRLAGHEERLAGRPTDR